MSQVRTLRSDLFSARIAIRVVSKVLHEHFAFNGAWMVNFVVADDGVPYLFDKRTRKAVPEGLVLWRVLEALRCSDDISTLAFNTLSEIEREAMAAAKIILSIPPRPSR
jgi:hypothetical protein